MDEMGEDEELDEIAREVRQVFLEESPAQVQLLEEQLLRLSPGAANREVLIRFSEVAHGLKGAAVIAGLSTFGELAAALEATGKSIAEASHAPSTEAVAILERAVRALRESLRELAHGSPMPQEARAVLARLKTWSDGSAASSRAGDECAEMGRRADNEGRIR